MSQSAKKPGRRPPPPRPPLGNQYAKGNRGGKGGPSKYRPEFVAQAELAARAGFTDFELSELFKVSEPTIYRWKAEYPEFAKALQLGKEIPDERVKRALYHRAIGYQQKAVKIFLPAGAKKPVLVDYIEHVPPDTTAAFRWLSNRDPENWRDVQKQEITINPETSEARQRTMKVMMALLEARAAGQLPPHLIALLDNMEAEAAQPANPPMIDVTPKAAE